MTGEARLGSIAVIGAGAWGTALALVAHRAGRRVCLWARDPAVASLIIDRRENARLPGVPIPAEIEVTDDARRLGDAQAWLVAVPAQHVRAVMGTLEPHRSTGTSVVICAKGLEEATGKMMTEVLAEACSGAPLAVLSGPSFAHDVARARPTGVTLAAAGNTGDALARSLASPSFRPYLSDDPVGVALCGAAKNVIAIACGIAVGRKLGDSARAALMTRGLAEIGRLLTALGGRTETLLGLAGLGDLALTCTSPNSRNFSLGVALGEGATLEAALARRAGVVEGVATAAALTRRAARHGVELPIAGAVDRILHHGEGLDRAIAELLDRPLRAEMAN
jgi:glycerol-3-phosphate dehydrogenase (NAD(P)+)